MKIIILISFFLSTSLLFSQEVCSKEMFDSFIKEINADFSNPETSPLTESDRQNFQGLEFFEYDEALCIKAKFIKTPNEKPFAMATTTDRTPMYVKFGEAHFVIEGKICILNLYQNADFGKKTNSSLFLPFSDVTSGNESYIGGRYLDIQIPTDDEIVINFNLAYNPYCAYNYKYSCPKVPLENDLNIEIKAGVKNFK